MAAWPNLGSMLDTCHVANVDGMTTLFKKVSFGVNDEPKEA